MHNVGANTIKKMEETSEDLKCKIAVICTY